MVALSGDKEIGDKTNKIIAWFLVVLLRYFRSITS
jgi:hypothetical protein